MRGTPSRNREDGCATGQPQELGPEAYFSVRRKVLDPRTPGRMGPNLATRSRQEISVTRTRNRVEPILRVLFLVISDLSLLLNVKDA